MPTPQPVATAFATVLIKPWSKNSARPSPTASTSTPDACARPYLSISPPPLSSIRKESRALRLQGDIRNLNDRLNVSNFASVFSGTAIAPPRTFSLRLKFDY